MKHLVIPLLLAGLMVSGGSTQNNTIADGEGIESGSSPSLIQVVIMGRICPPWSLSLIVPGCLIQTQH